MAKSESDSLSDDRKQPINLQTNLILESWKVCYLANFLVFPLYRYLEREFDITRPEWVTIFCLANEEPLCSQDIIARTWLPKNNIVRGVRLLHEKGLIKRTNDPADKRRVLLTLTTEGWKIYSQTLPYVIMRKDQLISCLSAEERQTFVRLLNKISQSLDEQADDLSPSSC